MYKTIGSAEQTFKEKEYEIFEYLKNTKFLPIEVDTFVKMIDLENFIEDEGWHPSDIQMEDPDVVFYAGKIGYKNIIGINYSGSNQIFTPNGIPINTEDFQLLKITKNLENDALSWVLLPKNSVESVKRTGKEFEQKIDDNFNIIKGEKGIRYQILENNEVKAAMFIVNNTIDTIYTSITKRKQKLSQKLIEKALVDFPNLKHSDIQTGLGKAYSKNSKLKKHKI